MRPGERLLRIQVEQRRIKQVRHPAEGAFDDCRQQIEADVRVRHRGEIVLRQLPSAAGRIRQDVLGRSPPTPMSTTELIVLQEEHVPISFAEHLPARAADDCAIDRPARENRLEVGVRIQVAGPGIVAASRPD